MLQSDIQVQQTRSEPVFNTKVIIAGGMYDSKSGDYQSACEVFDLQLDAWRVTARLKTDRLRPTLMAVGIDSALVLGGTRRAARPGMPPVLVRSAEFIDTVRK